MADLFSFDFSKIEHERWWIGRKPLEIYVLLTGEEYDAIYHGTAAMILKRNCIRDRILNDIKNKIKFANPFRNRHYDKLFGSMKKVKECEIIPMDPTSNEESTSPSKSEIRMNPVPSINIKPKRIPKANNKWRNKKKLKLMDTDSKTTKNGDFMKLFESVKDEIDEDELFESENDSIIFETRKMKKRRNNNNNNMRGYSESERDGKSNKMIYKSNGMRNKKESRHQRRKNLKKKERKRRKKQEASETTMEIGRILDVEPFDLRKHWIELQSEIDIEAQMDDKLAAFYAGIETMAEFDSELATKTNIAMLQEREEMDPTEETDIMLLD